VNILQRDICDILFGVPDDISVPHSTALEWLVKLDKQLKSGKKANILLNQRVLR